MEPFKREVIESHFLYPGMIYASSGQCAVTTLLGSCVAVCLWDPIKGAGGMNHYLLPLWNGEGLATPRYGNVAISMLIERLMALGCARSSLAAKIFGGANVLESPNGLLNIGERNIALAESTLAENGIRIISRDTGGTTGRKIMFLTGSGDVFVKKNRRPQEVKCPIP
jgi:chemotaxis protein CheD